MLNTALMAQAIDFIEEHLRDDIAVRDMADAVSLSVYYFCRSFNQATHHPPYDYLMRRRLAEAARELLQTDRKIIEIAYAYQFNNPETFSRAFKRVFDMQPNHWRKQGSFDSRVIMPRLTLAHLQHLAQGPYLQPQLIDRAELHLTGLMTLVQEDPSVIETLWSWFTHSIESGDDPTLHDRYGVLQYPGPDATDYFYLLGIPLRTMSPDIAWITKALPAQQCVRFIHKGLRRNLPLTLDYIYHTWRPQANVRLSSSTIVLHYGRDAEDSPHSETEVLIGIES
jgi:AraC family transcriptional regulator